MSVMIQIRNVPDEIHREMKSRAALAGMSLSDYLLNEIRQIAEQPSIEEFLARLDRYPEVTLPISPTDAVREERDSR